MTRDERSGMEARRRSAKICAPPGPPFPYLPPSEGVFLPFSFVSVSLSPRTATPPLRIITNFPLFLYGSRFLLFCRVILPGLSCVMDVSSRSRFFPFFCFFIFPLHTTRFMTRNLRRWMTTSE